MATERYPTERYPDNLRQKIVADYVINGNKSETARINNVSEGIVRKILKEEEQQEVLKLLEKEKEKTTQDTITYMQTQHETKKRILDKILKAIEGKVDNIDKVTNLRDLATAYGIILDKELKLLELNRQTEKPENNNGVINDLLEALNDVKKNK